MRSSSARTYLDLIGLPPTPVEHDAFVKDRNPAEARDHGRRVDGAHRVRGRVGNPMGRDFEAHGHDG